MAERFIRRNSALDPGTSQKPNANSVRVNSSDDTLRFGTGASGTTEKTVVDTSSVQSVAGKTIQGIAPVVVTATGALTAAAHDGKLVVYNNLAGGTLTLPAATGSGAVFKIFLGLTLTSGSFVLNVANAQDFMRGFAYTTQDAGGAGVSWGTANSGTVATESDTITWNRTTTGIGTIGDYIEAIDIAANVWAVETEQNSNGTEATPFSAAV